MNYRALNLSYSTSVNGKIPIERANAIIFKNMGDKNLLINQFPLKPGETLSTNQPAPNVIDDTVYTVSFDSTSVTPLLAIMATFLEEDNSVNNKSTC